MSSTEELENAIKHCEVHDMPLNFSSQIDEGTSATIHNIKLRNKPAAVKLFRKQFSKKKLLLVASKLRKLQNKNVVRFRGYSVRPCALLFQYCFVKIESEIVHNLSQLTSILNEKEQFNLNDRLSFILQATKGVQYLHGNGVIHRDIKPANLLVLEEFNNIVVKVADFDELLSMKETINATVTSNHMKGMTLAYTALVGLL